MTKVHVNDVVSWPRKSRELHSHHFDSTIWNDFEFRDDDIIIGTYCDIKFEVQHGLFAE